MDHAWSKATDRDAKAVDRDAFVQDWLMPPGCKFIKHLSVAVNPAHNNLKGLQKARMDLDAFAARLETATETHRPLPKGVTWLRVWCAVAQAVLAQPKPVRWTSSERPHGLPDIKPNPFGPDSPSLMPLLWEIVEKLIRGEGQQKYLDPLAPSTRPFDRVIAAPFAVVDAGKGLLLQFRFERLPRSGSSQQSADGALVVYPAPEQAFLYTDDKFSKAIFTVAPRAIEKLLAAEELSSNFDVRVWIQPLSVNNTLFGLFNPLFPLEQIRADTQGACHDKVIAGSSAGAAAGWGLYFLLSGKAPDPGLIAMGEISDVGSGVIAGEEDELNGDDEGQKQGFGGVGGIAAKARAVRDSKLFDTIVVASEDNRKAVEKGLGPDSGLRIVDLSAEAGEGSQGNLPQSPSPAPVES